MRKDRIQYSPEGASFVAGVSMSTIQREMAAGHLKSKKIGRRRVILAVDLEAWLNGANDDPPGAKLKEGVANAV